MNDFFIVNQFRRTGVGASAVREIFRRHHGQWEVGWATKNKPAELFWRSVTQPWHPENWPVPQAPGAPPLPGLRFVAVQK
jgi:predicted acetyltransferase